MSLYSSREPFNDDPFPRVTVHTGARHRDHLPTLDDDTECRYDPRPEYNRPQNNPTNAILAEFRGGDNYRRKITYYLEYLAGDVYDWRGLDSEKEHARKVLTRLAALKKEES